MPSWFSPASEKRCALREIQLRLAFGVPALVQVTVLVQGPGPGVPGDIGNALPRTIAPVGTSHRGGAVSGNPCPRSVRQRTVEGRTV
jgi:hypothetical protein